MLPRIVSEAGERVPVFIDSGFRRGSDVVKALALGARGVFLGRPVLYGLAAGGQQGVGAVLGLFADEVARTMTLMGVSRIADLGPHHLVDGAVALSTPAQRQVSAAA
jgi:(S)-mandelate dehydrogenase